jgi:hypothetical protein
MRDKCLSPSKDSWATLFWLLSAPFSMVVEQEMVRNPHNKAEAKKGYFLASDWVFTSKKSSQ